MTAAESQSAEPKADVSVIVPVHNVGDWVIEALESIGAQTLPPQEVIIIDDGSTDGAEQRIAPFLSDPAIRLIRTENRGLAAARNRGIAESRSTFIALLDADDRYRPEYLARMVTRITAPDQPAFVTCDAESFGAHQYSGERFSSRYPQSEPINLARFLSGQVAIFGLSLIRRSALEAVGGYDEKLRSAEDLDLWLRLLASGATGGLVPEILVDYRRHGGSLSSRTAQLMRDTALAYGKLLADLPDGETRRLAEMRRIAASAAAEFNEGVDAVLSGDVRGGVRQMRSSGGAPAGLKWRFALIAMAIAPMLAPPLLRNYRGFEF